jgi:hypothetical protein
VNSPYSSFGKRKEKKRIIIKKHEIEEKKISLFSSARHFLKFVDADHFATSLSTQSSSIDGVDVVAFCRCR